MRSAFSGASSCCTTVSDQALLGPWGRLRTNGMKQEVSIPANAAPPGLAPLDFLGTFGRLGRGLGGRDFGRRLMRRAEHPPIVDRQSVQAMP